VSINLDEAKEKIRYVKAIVEAIDRPVRPVMVRDSATEVEFANGSRFISHPCRPPRGKGRARIYLDEMAHYREGLDRDIYTAALPATVKGDGYIRIGSSPLGASGLFWEIATEAMRRYPGYSDWRRLIPWWHVGALCKDTATAARVAPEMLINEGTARIFESEEAATEAILGGKINPHYVYVVQDGVAHKRIVEVGIIEGARCEIIDGLKPGETMVVNGMNYLTDGIAVEVVRLEDIK